ncbi:MAG: putative membrane protein [halophilic archaeon J07HX64]|jgi:Predicted membrane protein|nr:MAG: putative membrane protein [halophilic archaeon J07HX64]
MPTQDEEGVGGQGRLLSYLRGRRETVAVYLKGFAMGSAATVPGVSGGTIALILGIYDRFIRALTGIDGRLAGLATGIHRTEGREQFRAAVHEQDLPFLFVLFAGVGTAVLTLARVISAALAAAPGPMFSFFGGLIAASAFVLFDRRWLTRLRHGVAAVAGFSIAFLVAGASGVGLFPETLPVVFFAAAIAISGMVLPGLSGSFLLLLLGQYEYLTDVASRVIDHAATLASGTVPSGLTADLTVIATFGFGAIAGFFTTAHAVSAALERYPGVTFAFLVSLMLGALNYPVIRISEETDLSAAPLAVVVLAALAGAVLVLVFDRYTKDLEYGESDAFAGER